jgi:hypothetical protein
MKCPGNGKKLESGKEDYGKKSYRKIENEGETNRSR